MKDMRKTIVGLIIGTGLGLTSAMVYAQAVITPYSPNEVGPALTEQEEAALGNTIGGGSVPCEAAPYSPPECGGAEALPAGGTVAPELGGVLPGASLDRLPETPGPQPEDLIGQPE